MKLQTKCTNILQYPCILLFFILFLTKNLGILLLLAGKTVRLSDNLGEVMITQRFHHFITRQNYLLLKPDVLRRGSNLQFIRSRSYVPLTIALMRIITKLITFSSLNEQLSWLQVRKVRSNLVKAEMRVLQKTQKNLIIYYIKRSEILLIGVSGLFIF